MDIDLLCTVDKSERKIFPFRDKEWAEYIVFNRIIRKEYTPHKFKWTYGSLADGKFVGFLCKQYFNREIDIDQLIHGYMDGETRIQGIAPYSASYDQLSFHEDEEFVNAALKLHKIDIIARHTLRQKG